MLKFLNILLLLTVVLSCKQEQVKPLNVGINLWPGYQPLSIAVEKGWLTNDQVNIQEFPSSDIVLEKLAKAELDMAGLTLDEAIKLNQTTPLAILLIADISDGADAILGSGDMATMADIVGKKVGYEKSTVGKFHLHRALEKSQVSPQSFTHIHVDVDKHEEYMKTGKVDVVVTFEPYRSRILANGAKVLFDSKKIPNEIIDVLVVRKDLLTKGSKKVLKSIHESWFKVIDFIYQNNKLSATSMSARVGLSVDQVLNVFEYIKYPRVEESRLLMKKDLPVLSQKLISFINFYEKTNLKSTPELLSDF